MQIQQEEESHSLSINSKLSTIKALEEECNKAKLCAQEQIALSTAAAHEANGLHGAMASLHGEISILTREIEGDILMQILILMLILMLIWIPRL